MRLIDEFGAYPFRLTYSTKGDQSDRFEWRSMSKWNVDRIPYNYALDELMASESEESESSEDYEEATEETPEA